MLYITSSHLMEFPFMLITGMILFGICAFFAAARRLMCAGVWLSLGCDILMGIMLAAVFCISVTLAADGRIRLYHPLLTILGASITKAALCILSGKCSFPAGLLHRLTQNRIIRALLK